MEVTDSDLIIEGVLNPTREQLDEAYLRLGLAPPGWPTLPVTAAGDLPGHPFRGNQWTGGSDIDPKELGPDWLHGKTTGGPIGREVSDTNPHVMPTDENPSKPGLQVTAYHTTRREAAEKIIKNGWDIGQAGISMGTVLGPGAYGSMRTPSGADTQGSMQEWLDKPLVDDSDPSRDVAQLELEVTLNNPVLIGGYDDLPGDDYTNGEGRWLPLEGQLAMKMAPGTTVDDFFNQVDIAMDSTASEFSANTQALMHFAKQAGVDGIIWRDPSPDDKLLGDQVVAFKNEAVKVKDARIPTVYASAELNAPFALWTVPDFLEAVRPVTAAGDLPGHPFRGNQYTDGVDENKPWAGGPKDREWTAAETQKLLNDVKRLAAPGKHNWLDYYDVGDRAEGHSDPNVREMGRQLKNSVWTNATTTRRDVADAWIAGAEGTADKVREAYRAIENGENPRGATADLARAVLDAPESDVELNRGLAVSTEELEQLKGSTSLKIDPQGFAQDPEGASAWGVGQGQHLVQFDLAPNSGGHALRVADLASDFNRMEADEGEVIVAGRFPVAGVYRENAVTHIQLGDKSYFEGLTAAGDLPGHPFRGNQYTEQPKLEMEDAIPGVVARAKPFNIEEPKEGGRYAPLSPRSMVGGQKIVKWTPNYENRANGGPDADRAELEDGTVWWQDGNGYLHRTLTASVQEFGDLPGHEFRGNQWTGGLASEHGEATGGISSDLKKLGLDPATEKLLLRNWKSKGFTVNEEKQKAMQAAKEQALIAISSQLGYSLPETTAAVSKINDFMQAWYMSGGTSGIRTEMETAWLAVKNGETPTTDAERAAVMQKAYTDMVWDAKYGPDVESVPVIRGVSGEYAAQLELADKLGESWSANTYPLTSWAVPDAHASVANWVGAGVQITGEANKDEVFAMYTGEPNLRETGLKVKGEFIMDGEGAVDDGHNTIEPLYGGRSNQYGEARDNQRENYLAEGLAFNKNTGGTAEQYILGRATTDGIQFDQASIITVSKDSPNYASALGVDTSKLTDNPDRQAIEEANRDLNYSERRDAWTAAKNEVQMENARVLQDIGHTPATIKDIATNYTGWIGMSEEVAKLEGGIARAEADGKYGKDMPLLKGYGTLHEGYDDWVRRPDDERIARYWRDELIPNYRAQAETAKARLDATRSQLNITMPMVGPRTAEEIDATQQARRAEQAAEKARRGW